jgi:stage IV sporulation protein B
VLSVRRGKAGQPGQLMGALSASNPLGTLGENTPMGVFGTCGGWKGQPMPTAEASQIHTGAATILSTVNGETPQEYSVEILKIYANSDKMGRNLLLKVTDPRLLQTTGGIVQGMSGSPIIQDGKLVGAVTHVLVNDPTTGYGIFIENMLDAAA